MALAKIYRLPTQADSLGQLSVSGSNIVMGASVVTIGGVQYVVAQQSVAIGSPAANALAMLYYVVVGNAVTFVQSANVNSIGPAGAAAWKLIGAWYANGLASPGFGSFCTIYGTPTTNLMGFLPTGNFTNTIYTGFKRRVGDSMEYKLNAGITGTPALSSGSRLLISVAESVDTNKMTALQTYHNWGSASSLSAGNAIGSVEMGIEVSAPVSFSFWVQAFASSSGHSYTNLAPTSPLTYGTGDFVQAQAMIPIVGFSNTQLLDL